jgi:hypothetical protein
VIILIFGQTDSQDLPLPRRGVLSGKSLRTSRRWRLFFVRFLPRNAMQK